MKRTIAISIATVLLTAIVAVETSSGLSAQRRASDEEKGGWEYLVVQGGTVNLSGGDGGSMRKGDGAFGRESYPVEKNMDKLGAKGWELVAVIGAQQDPVYYFKRRK